MIGHAIRKFKVTRFNGVNQSVSMGNRYPFEVTDAWSASVWARTTSGSFGSLIDKRTSPGTFRGWCLQHSGGGFLFVRLGFGSGGGTIEKTTVPTTITDGNWHHIVMTYSGSVSSSGIRIYFDAAQPAIAGTTDTLSGSIVDTGSLCFGCRDNNDSFFNGDLQDGAIFNGVLSAADVTALFDRGVPPDVRDLTLSTGGPRSYWLLGEHKGDTSLAAGVTSGSSVPDLGTSGFAGTMFNTPAVVTRL